MSDEDAPAGRPRFSRPSLSRPSLSRLPSLPHLPVVVAAGLTGLVCGALAVGLVWSGEHGCDAVRGRPSCGGYGVGMLLVILAVTFAVGVLLLTMLHVAHVAVTAFFGVAVPLFVVMAFLLDHVFDPWMAWALPLMGAASFAVSTYLARGLAAANHRPYAVDDHHP